MSDSMRVDQILNQIRSIREQTMDVAQPEKITTEGSGGSERVEFSSLLKQSIDSVNATQQQASQMAAAFERGLLQRKAGPVCGVAPASAG